MMKRCLLLLFLCPFLAAAQNQEQIGTVSYLNDQNVYLRFSNTAGISAGDSVFVSTQMGKACLVVLKVSSISCLTQRVGNCELELGQKLFLKTRNNEKALSPDLEKTLEREEVSGELAESPADSLAQLSIDPIARKGSQRRKDRGYLNVGLSNGSSLNSAGRYTARTVLRSTLKVDSLFNKNLSLESYFNAQQFQRSYASEAATFRANVYQLALVYRPNERHQITVGRKLNRRISSLGAIDGVQWEVNWANWSSGLILGSRPDFSTFGLNPSLMQYGAYGAYDWQKTKHNGQISFGILEQRNAGAIDRRYLYTQQSFRRGALFFFASAEAELYENFDTAQAKNNFRLSSLYLSLRYRASSRLNLFASYDSREQIIFFERYSSDIEKLLAEQGARQGYRLRADFRFFKSTHLGLSYNYRSNPTFGNGSQNAQVYVSQGNLPWIKGTLTFRFNKNQNGYLSSEINSLRYSRSFTKGSYISLYGRYASYLYPQREITLDPQMYYGAEYTWQLAKKWHLGLNAEYGMLGQQDVYRVNFRLSKGFTF